jgi:hypothetical protein
VAYLGRVAGRSMPPLLLLLLSSSPSSRCVLAMSTGLSGCLSGFIRGGPPQQRAGLGAQACLAMPCSSQLPCQLTASCDTAASSARGKALALTVCPFFRSQRKNPETVIKRSGASALWRCSFAERRSGAGLLR